jgi:hypothetical protein
MNNKRGTKDIQNNQKNNNKMTVVSLYLSILIQIYLIPQLKIWTGEMD